MCLGSSFQSAYALAQRMCKETCFRWWIFILIEFTLSTGQPAQRLRVVWWSCYSVVVVSVKNDRIADTVYQYSAGARPVWWHIPHCFLYLELAPDAMETNRKRGLKGRKIAETFARSHNRPLKSPLSKSSRCHCPGTAVSAAATFYLLFGNCSFYSPPVAAA